MPIINLRKHYYPVFKADTFIEVNGAVAETLEEGQRIERRQEQKRLYHKVFSMDTNDWAEFHISVYAPSPEDMMLQSEERAEKELNLRRMKESFAHLTPTQARRIRARYMGGKKLREIGEAEGMGESQAGHSIRSGIQRMRHYFIQHNWLESLNEVMPMDKKEELPAKRADAQKNLSQLENRQKILLNQQRDAERRARTRRLIEHGAILEGVFPATTDMEGKAVKAFLIALSRLPVIGDLLETAQKTGVRE